LLTGMALFYGRFEKDSEFAGFKLEIGGEW
jgi:hypothetical protein